MAISVINGGGDTSKVPITRTINGKPLSDDITLTASDINLATLTGTLAAGNTMLVLSDDNITSSSTVDVYTSTWGVNPSSVVASSGKVTLTFEAQSSALNVKVEVRS